MVFQIANQTFTALGASDILVCIVENRKSKLTSKQELKSSVDWLTEVIRRFSEAWLQHKDLATVDINMQDHFRLEKVYLL